MSRFVCHKSSVQEWENLPWEYLIYSALKSRQMIDLHTLLEEPNKNLVYGYVHTINKAKVSKNWGLHVPPIHFLLTYILFSFLQCSLKGCVISSWFFPALFFEKNRYYRTRVKLFQDSFGAAFVYDWQPPLIFAQFTSNFFNMCTYCTAHAQEVWGKSDKD